MMIAFPTKGELDQRERAVAIALLSRLLLQVATADGGSEGNDDAL